MTSLTRLATQALGFDVRPSNDGTVKDDYMFYIELGIVAFVTFLVLGNYVLWPAFTLRASTRPPQLWLYSAMFGVAYMVVAAFYHITLRHVAMYVDKHTGIPPQPGPIAPTPTAASTANGGLPLLGTGATNGAANAVPANGVITPAVAIPNALKTTGGTANATSTSNSSTGTNSTAQPYVQSAIIPLQSSTAPAINRQTNADLRSIIFGPGRKAM